MTRLATVINKIIDIINTKQPALVSGENIKKLNGTDIVGSGNIPVKTVGGESILGDGNVGVKTINGETMIGSGDAEIVGTGTLSTTAQNIIGAINELDTDKAEQADLTILTGRVSTAEGDIDALDTRVTQAEAAVGTPLVASTVAGMTDKTKIYVYTGSETGYTSGNWYYWNGTAWTSGGVYNSTAFETDTTLAVSGKAADAKVTGDEITYLKSDINLLGDALINDTNYIINLNTVFKQGVVHNRAYSNPDTTDTITTYSSLFKKKYMPFSLHVDIANGYKALMVFYSSDDDTSAITGTWLTGNNTITDVASTLSDDYFCVEVRKTDNTAIIPSEATSAVSVYYSMPLLVDRKKVVNIQADSTSALTITETCDICGNGHTINVGQNAEFGLHILGDSGVVVDVYDLTIKGGTESAVRVTHGATVNFYNCSFEDATNHGLSVVNSNTNCFDCIAQNNGVDGFNYHLVGKNTAYNCFALNNGDDGISNHEDSSLKIIGGRFVGNGKAGIAGPTYGAGNTDISNVYCADNVQYGIIVHNDSALTEKVIIQNAILDSSPVGLAVNGYQVITHGVVYANCTTNTTVGNGGTITAL